MSWSPKVILASNFYGSYFHAEDFDDTVIIPDGDIDTLMVAAERRAKIYSQLTDREADLYVFCVAGLTDMVEKLMVGAQYVLKPIPDAISIIERRMKDAVVQLNKHGAKIIWSTTYPISLSKYHRSQGWNIDNMQQFGLSKGMETEQRQLFSMAESLMDLCHTFNKRIGMEDLFFIRKVYYSRDGQRELLTHNLLEDGINPTTAVTAEWNIELSKYLQQIRQPRVSAIPTLLDKNLNSGSSLPLAPGDTLFTYGSSGASAKRQFADDFDPYRKRPKLGDSLADALGSQPENVQKKLAMGMLKFISDNLGEGLLNSKVNEGGSLLSKPSSSQSSSRWDGNPSQGNVNSSSSRFQSSTDSFGPVVNSANRGDQLGYSQARLASGYGGHLNVGNSSFGTNSVQNLSSQPYNSGYSRHTFGSGQGTTSFSSRGQGNQISGSRFPNDGFKKKPRVRPHKKAKHIVTPTRTIPGLQTSVGGNNKPQSVGIKTASPHVISPKQPNIVMPNPKSNLPEKASTNNGSIIKPKSVKERLHVKNPSKVDALLRDPVAAIKPKNIKDRLNWPAKKRLNANSSGSSGMQASDEFLLNTDVGSPKKQPLLVEPKSSHLQRHVELQYGGATVPKPITGKPAVVGKVPGHDQGPSQIGAMPKGIPNLLRSMKTGSEPHFTVDKYKIRSDYILMAMKPSDNSTRFCRIAADYDDNEHDTLGAFKMGWRRIAAFDRRKDLGDRDILPSVAFLKTNQWDPGHEKVSAPMTVLQKEVATFNTALYQLMTAREELVQKLGKTKDASIRLSKEQYISAHDKLYNAMPKPPGKIEAVDKSEPSQSAVHLEEANSNIAETIDNNVDEVKKVEGDRADDWTDLEGPNSIEFVDINDDGKLKAADQSKDDQVESEGMEVDRNADDRDEQDVNSLASAQAVAQCFDISEDASNTVDPAASGETQCDVAAADSVAIAVNQKPVSTEHRHEELTKDSMNVSSTLSVEQPSVAEENGSTNISDTKKMDENIIDPSANDETSVEAQSGDKAEETAFEESVAITSSADVKPIEGEDEGVGQEDKDSAAAGVDPSPANHETSPADDLSEIASADHATKDEDKAAAQCSPSLKDSASKTGVAEEQSPRTARLTRSRVAKSPK